MNNYKTMIEFVPTVPRFFAGSEKILAQKLFSHRSPQFDELHKNCRCALRKLSGCNDFDVVISAGSGTTANDIMLASYLNEFKRPLVISNGEFGQRLYRQSRHINSATAILDLGFGGVFTESEIQKKVENADVLLAVACESSTGMLNPIEQLNRYNLPILLDGISAVGVVDDFFQCSNVLAVSGSSGKALAALPGISIVYFRRSPCVIFGENMPASLDITSLIKAWEQPGGCRNTLSSQSLSLLNFSCNWIIDHGGVSAYADRLRKCKNSLIGQLSAIGVTPCTRCDSAIISVFNVPENWSDILHKINTVGLDVYSQVEYLTRRNMFAVAMLGDYTSVEVDKLAAAFIAASQRES